MNILGKSVCVSLVTIFTGVLSSIAAYAEEPPARDPIAFSVYDKDGSGFISEDEFNSVREARMKARVAEGRPMRGMGKMPTFADFDSNGDKQLSKEELAAGQQAQQEKRGGMGMKPGMGMGKNMPKFSEFDLNKDGKILETEFYEARNQRIAERAQQGYQMKGLENAPSFADIDTNGNGEISPEEFSAHQSQRVQQRTQ